MGQEIEDEFSARREAMVEQQLVKRGISDVRVLGAMRKVPRHLFVTEEFRHKAYDDIALPIGQGQTISQPYMVAVMTELLDLRPTGGATGPTGEATGPTGEANGPTGEANGPTGCRVLELGTGSGYQTAVLAELSGEVFTIERVPELSAKAVRILESLGYDNVHIQTGDGTGGWPEEAPFNRILVTAGSPAVPAPLREQLSDGGVIVLPVGSRISQELLKIRKRPGGFSESRHTPCVFVPLVGEHGWKDSAD